MNDDTKFTIKKVDLNITTFLLPILISVIGIILDLRLPDVKGNINSAEPLTFFRFLLMFFIIIFVFCTLISIKSIDFMYKYKEKVPFYSVIIILLIIYNLLTKKSGILPIIYFPSIDMILTALYNDREILLKCTLYSLRLLTLGVFFGGTIGFITGVIIGWNEKVFYWVFPIVRFIGPIPTTIWIPISMILFPSLLSASVFIVGLSMWFPVTFLTSSGIQNIDKSLFEAGETLGADVKYQILHIAIPAALPEIFIGFFSGMIASLISLISAELIGAKFGLGWFINWQQQVLAYDHVYAGFILIAFICFILFKIIFKIKSKLLIWKKDTVRW